MSKFIDPDVQDNGLNHIKNNATTVAAVIAYTPGDSRATVMAAGNVVVQATTTSADFTVETSSGNNRRIVSAVKSATPSQTADPTHIVFVSASKVLWATDETSTGTVGTAGPANIGSCTLNSTSTPT